MQNKEMLYLWQTESLGLLLAFLSWWNLANLKICLQESRIMCNCFMARGALNPVYLLLRQAEDGITVTVDDIFLIVSVCSEHRK